MNESLKIPTFQLLNYRGFKVVKNASALSYFTTDLSCQIDGFVAMTRIKFLYSVSGYFR